MQGTLEKAEKEITVNFNIQKVKEAIMSVFNHMPTKYMVDKDGINDIFNTYHFCIANGLNNAIADITLQEVDAEKTKILITVTNTYGAKGSNSILSGLLDKYLLVLGKALSGEDMEEVKKTAGNSGCMVLLTTIIAVLSLIWIFFL